MSTTTRSRLPNSTRRSADNWPEGRAASKGTRRITSGKEADVIRFPDRGPAAVRSQDAVAHRLTTVQATWSDHEREFRRLQAIRKQEELLTLLAGATLEDEVRLAVADGEQPIVPPEIELLRN